NARSRSYRQRSSPDCGSRPTTAPPSAVATVPPDTTGAVVAVLGARQSSASVRGRDCAAARVGTGPSQVVDVVPRASEFSQTTLAATRAVTTSAAATRRSVRVRRSGASTWLSGRRRRDRFHVRRVLLLCATGRALARAGATATTATTCRSGRPGVLTRLRCGRPVLGLHRVVRTGCGHIRCGAVGRLSADGTTADPVALRAGSALALDALALLTVLRGGGSILADASGGVGRDVQLLEQVRGARVGFDRIRDTEIESLVDELPARHVVPVDEGDRDTGASGATGTADAMDVGLLVLGALVVDDVGDVVDVDAAGGDVRGDEHV